MAILKTRRASGLQILARLALGGEHTTEFTGTSRGPSTQEESDTQSDGEPMGAGPGPFSEDVTEELVNQARYLVNLERQSDIQRAAIEKLIEEVGRLKLAVDNLTAIGRNGVCGVLDSESGEMCLEPYDTCPAHRAGDHCDRVRGSRRSPLGYAPWLAE
ncbi:unnamed protein product, partial [Aphanomyces euteiches]